ncbi:MAG: aa3-type cytochrome c oxidase subunit IV [Alphaproteobacteria bacterium]|jgi:hypothetical protein|nr:aa3-type cytochrome c oxidase subunit IV [Alphaproteobacteria bacterium]
MATDNNPSSNIRANEETYNGFLGMTKWSIILVAITLVLLFAFVFGE